MNRKILELNTQMKLNQNVMAEDEWHSNQNTTLAKPTDSKKCKKKMKLQRSTAWQNSQKAEYRIDVRVIWSIHLIGASNDWMASIYVVTPYNWRCCL